MCVLPQVGIVSLASVHRPERDLWGPSNSSGGGSRPRAPLPSFSPAPAAAVKAPQAAAAPATSVEIDPTPAPSSAAGTGMIAAAVVATGPELSRFSPSDWAWLLRHPEIVLARTTPEQKLEFVKARPSL